MALILRVCDKKITSIYVTALATFSNFTGSIHTFYIYRVVDHFDIYYPQVVISIISVFVAVMLRKKFLELDGKDIQSWWIPIDKIKVKPE